ncbi:MAG TPA: alanine--tRNA ligase, partial [Terriglobales bacterium]|nr:alanine--tRNA ligase [Terriglobales bacterium]
MLTGSQIRRKFLDFFIEKGHREVHSSSLVPQNDPTLLFTNAGMNQFKDVFLGLEKRDYSRATTSQKCVRAGGKHNDLENVGFTNRHHTFFEMLGNFSFGDYFKKDAIAYAWELITSPKWFGIPKEKLYATIFKGENGVERDAEAYDLWLAQGVAKNRIYEFGAKDNFWQMGDTGPCGPCSEIHYDMGVIASDQGHTNCEFGCECGRYVEIWNLVFMQFDRDAGGKLTPLPKPSIDTGAGLERVASVLQGVISNYDTDLFTPLIKRAAELTGTSTAHGTGKSHVGTGAPPVQDEQGSPPTAGTHGAASLRVIADHSRAATFLISDGVIPSNEGRGYVLRKIIRRAITHGRLLGQNKPFLHEMVFSVRDLMQDAYPELKETAERVSKAVLAEETRFAHTMEVGLQRLEQDLRQAHDVLDRKRLEKELENGPVYDGAKAFKLYDTFGVPLDFMQDAARDQGILFDQAGFDAAMDEQRQRARASWKGAAKQTANPEYQKLPTSVFEGYRQTKSEACEVVALLKQGQGTRELKAGEEGEVILDHTPFYAESGGQVGDRGWLYSDDHYTIMAEVTGSYYPVQGVRAHKVVAKQALQVGAKVDAVVDTGIRAATMRNHTATHLLHAGLREVLGKHVKQAGSLVAPNHLRFEFSHFTAVADEELQDIED